MYERSIPLSSVPALIQWLVVQEIGREGIIPFSRFWASNKPFNAPLAGLFEHYVVSAIIMLAPPPGDAYNFLLKFVEPTLSIPLLTQPLASYPTR